MSRIKVKQLEAGRQLSEDVVNTNGRLLLKAGTTIVAKHLEILRTWGVVEVDIVGDGVAEDEPNISFSELPTEVKNRIYLSLKQQFKHCNLKHPVIKELVLFQRGRLAREWLEVEKEQA
jgi:hypothetical protein